MTIISDKRMLAFGLGCFALGGLSGFREASDYMTARIVPKPDIGISFDNPSYAEQLRQSGDLDIETLYCASRDAVENYYYHGLTGAAGKVTILIPSREDLRAARKEFPEKSTGCEPN